MQEIFGKHPLKKHDATERQVRWGITGKDFHDYLCDFYQMDMNAQIPERIAWLMSLQLPIIIDLMATTHAVRSISEVLEMGKKYQALAVSYTDEDEPPNPTIWTTHLTGDLNTSKTWTDITHWLNGRKAHLLMARPFGGLQHIPTRSLFYRIVTSRSWDMLDPNGGTLLCQIPPLSVLTKRQIPILEWTNQLEKNGIDYQYLPSYSSRDKGRNYGLFMAIKHPHTPDLPIVTT